jgi:hypothetical protein
MPSPPLPDYLWAVLGAKYAASDGDVLAAARAVGRSARWARAQLELYPAIADAVARREQSSEVDTAAGKAPTNELDDERLGPRAPCALAGPLAGLQESPLDRLDNLADWTTRLPEIVRAIRSSSRGGPGRGRHRSPKLRRGSAGETLGHQRARRSSSRKRVK